MATNTDILKDIQYIDEELDDIEYTEILSFEEMSKINPSFIAMDKEDIYNNLYNFFKDKKKTDLVRALFYEILKNRDSNNGKIEGNLNYVFAVEGEIEKYWDDNTKDAYYNFIGKYNNQSELSEFVKRKFCVTYDNKSTKIRLKPTHNTTTIITENDKLLKGTDYPKYYPIYKEYPVINCANTDKVENVYNINDGDDISLPVIGAFYKIPTTTTSDYMYAKIASHLFNSVNTNYRSATHYKDIYELSKNIRPDIGMSIEEIGKNKESFYLDYGNINNILKKYDYSLDFITEKDLESLTVYMDDIVKGEKERKNTHGAFKVKRPVLTNKKLTFFDNIDKVLKVINISPEVISFLEKTKDIIHKYKEDVIQGDVVPLQNYNLFDIIKQINADSITIEDVLEELKLSIKTIAVDNTLATINDILEAKENIGDIKDDCERVRQAYIYSREHIFAYDTDGKKYVISKRENKAICDGNDIDNYEGVDDDDDIIDDDNKGVANVDASGAGSGMGGGAGGMGGGASGANVVNNYDLNRYIANIHFKNEKGFIEMLRIILEMTKKINDVANIDIDYDEISAYLFKKYRSVSTRYDKYFKEFEKNNIDDARKYAKKYAELTPIHILYIKPAKNASQIDKKIAEIVKKVNEDVIDTINIIFFNTICFWVVDIQEKILKGSVQLNMNYLNPNHIDKLNTRGLLYYIIEIISDFFKYNDDNAYIINIKDLRKGLIHILENEYKDRGVEILGELINKKGAENKNKCSIEKYKYKDDELYYIDKLLYTPNNSKYEKIHKYIQGCCLRKLDINFNDISDFVTSDNSEIIKLKEQYSKDRLISKTRDIRFTPPKMNKKTAKAAKAAKVKKGTKVAKGRKGRSESDDEDYASNASNASDASDASDDIFVKELKEKNKGVRYIFKKPYTYNIKRYGIDGWLESMRGKTDLLPNNLIDNIINYDKDAINLVITDNIKRLSNTKNNLSADLLKCEYINYKEILLNICKILYGSVNASSKYKDNELLKKKVMKAIKEIRKMSNNLFNLNKNYNPEEADLIRICNLLVISNSFNYPELSGVENIPKDFVAYNAQKLNEYLKDYLGGKYNRFLTPEEIELFINKKREEYKNRKLKENQDLDVEENDIRRQAKAAGILKDAHNAKKKGNDEDNGSDAGDGDGDASDYDSDGSDDAGGRGGGRAARGAKAADVDDGDIGAAYKNDDKDDDYNSKSNDNYNIYDDNDDDNDI